MREHIQAQIVYALEQLARAGITPLLRASDEPQTPDGDKVRVKNVDGVDH
jgi:hypothetical protein